MKYIPLILFAIFAYLAFAKVLSVGLFITLVVILVLLGVGDDGPKTS